MPNYADWNLSIIEYVTSGVPKGNAIFIDIDDHSILNIACEFLNQTWSDTETALEDFTNAVTEKCVIYSNGDYVIDTDMLDDCSTQSQPTCVAFLALTVIAAYQMLPEELDTGLEIGQNNYFIRLRQTFKLPVESGGRPKGLQIGTMETLWKTWNDWIDKEGWISSAEPGLGSLQYINYPLSQAILRRIDQERLLIKYCKAYQKNLLSPGLDRYMLGSLLRNMIGSFDSKHLQMLVEDTDPRRYAAFVDAAYDVYQSISWDNVDQILNDRNISRQYRPPSRISAGLYRIEDRILGFVQYYAYPEQPRRLRLNTLEIIYNDRPVILDTERPGYFSPIGESDFTNGMSYGVIGHSSIKELLIPEREFWILVRDNIDPESGIFASWRSPDLGETFLTVINQSQYDRYSKQLELLRHEGLITWDSVQEIKTPYGIWHEYIECMVLSRGWGQITEPICPEFFHSLKPKTIASVRFYGGLRCPQSLSWMYGYQPKINIVTFKHKVRFEVVSLSTGEISEPVEMETNVLFDLPNKLIPGSYRIDITISGRKFKSNILRITDWNDLETHIPEESFSTNIGSVKIEGAYLYSNNN